ncbi:pyruvate kinase [Desulforamulus hydrothermalis]|uniref:Pyruvate kinase n=1 Tax=Desulforamulus hydrothermalis Lam5 = DSM 18033 TaxID=1121428 RepID=K8DZS3_9FIRM|nr:pyruvate kinase [Desulforamulus hydrothermalis]CCO08649.1 Pyruvate kinase [Desulforamulus hydrothermalis Lam5 = DSM 18033]SHH00302.1 pyruvate kinase [Desulforamulus hydrothermalis Lam5 = DSM 18033]
MRKTKIVCTIGPASENSEQVKRLLAAGMDVARLNFSHGTHQEHGRRIAVLRQEAARMGKHLAIILDTKGPEIRTGMVPEQGVYLNSGATFVLDSDPAPGSPERVSITYAELWREVEPGTRILIDDGQMELEVTAVAPERITTVVLSGGLLKSQKGVNVPGASIQLPAVTAKDEADIRFGLAQGIDFIAASFVRKAADVLAVRRIVEEAGADVQIIAKIENREGLANLDAILQVADGLMVARGDLGVEIPAEEVPIAQKEMIKKCNLLGKPVIVATQMLDSMIRQPRPTRAEASDVANAILDGADAIMLSGETAAGKYPVEAVMMMDKIARRTETILANQSRERSPHINVTEAISHAGCTIAEDLQAAAILTPTHSGLTARMISKQRPRCPIVAATPFAATARRLALQWGVQPLLVPAGDGTDQVMAVAVTTALQHRLVQTGDLVVITAGVPAGQTGTTNMIKIQVVGNILTRGAGIGRQSYAGTARLITSADPATFNKGDILVAASLDADFMPLAARAGALVVEEGGLTSPAAIAALHFGIPAVVGAAEALTKISEGETITVDALSGAVYQGSVAIL